MNLKKIIARERRTEASYHQYKITAWCECIAKCSTMSRERRVALNLLSKAAFKSGNNEIVALRASIRCIELEIIRMEEQTKLALQIGDSDREIRA